jgi:hypothetical protein
VISWRRVISQHQHYQHELPTPSCATSITHALQTQHHNTSNASPVSMAQTSSALMTAETFAQASSLPVPTLLRRRETASEHPSALVKAEARRKPHLCLRITISHLLMRHAILRNTHLSQAHVSLTAIMCRTQEDLPA